MKVIEDNKDANLSYIGRATEIKIGSESISMPIRGASTLEYNAISKIPADIEIQDIISIIPRMLNYQQTEWFLKTNGYHNELQKYLHNKNLSTMYSKLILNPIFPADTYLKNNRIDVMKFNRLSLFIQNQLQQEKYGFKILPTIFFPPSVNSDSLLQLFASYKNKDVWVPLIPMDMAHDKFKKIMINIYELEDTGQIPLVLFIYKDPLKTLLNYDYIWINRDKKVIYGLIQVPREEIGNLSGVHLLINFGFDFISRKVYFVGGKPRIPEGREPYEIVKYFIRQSVEIKPEYAIEGDVPLFKDMPHYEYIEYAYTHRKSTIITNNELENLAAISNVHEFWASSNELGEYKNSIIKRAAEDYLNEKGKLKKYIDSFRNRSKKRRTLI